MTLYEVSLIIEGVTNARKRERDEFLFLAWHTAYLTAYAPQKSNGFIKLEKLLGDTPAPTGRQMTPEQIEAVMRTWLGSRHQKNR
ncbi:hypothetical protein RE411_04605 [Agrobacterium pusense]|uniref:hypothetical protein n=1 Tax=Agrobacterium pusense TaxID=648995 RepID=UPI002867DC80|nr:hypothetical protein [Agrobacterium pusense]WMW56469.1 hypothetical protein RE411_04605 [Agrobacterium pusense]